MPLIVLEGIDGCGKSTQARRLVERLGGDAVLLREPGGTALGEQVRQMLLDTATRACPVAEFFGYQMARAQLCAEVLSPALAAGRWVVLDRFWHSSLAYQAYGLGIDVAQARAAIALALGGVQVDCGILLRLDPAEAARRRAAARGTEDRIEARGLDYLRRVAAGYDAIAAAEDMTVLDAAGEVAAVEERVWAAVERSRAG